MVAMGRDGLRRSLVDAVQQAHEAGELGLLAVLRIRRVTQPWFWNRLDNDARKCIGEQIESFCIEQGSRAGVVAAAAAGTIDWNALLQFLQQLMPLILEFIKELTALLG
jgi:hypothetical protein